MEVCSSWLISTKSIEWPSHMYIAALRMKGVVSPQHAPTIKKPRIQRKMDGCDSFATGVAGSIVATASTENLLKTALSEKCLTCCDATKRYKAVKWVWYSRVWFLRHHIRRACAFCRRLGTTPQHQGHIEPLPNGSS